MRIDLKVDKKNVCITIATVICLWMGLTQPKWQMPEMQETMQMEQKEIEDEKKKRH